jgi:RNA 2',3'-cyclic 3'-phosphodiesterase
VKRLFVAVDVDESTRDDIATVSLRLREKVSTAFTRARISWVPPDRLHLTLEFLGGVDDTAEPRVIAALAVPFSVPPFHLSFEGLGLFPSGGPPRVLWLGIADGLTQLRQLRADIRRRLADTAGPAEDFNPHLTLARFRDRVSRTELERIVAIRPVAGPSPIDRVTVYESHLSPRGPAYTKVTEALLTPCE